METDGRHMCEVLVGLGEVGLGGVEELRGGRLRVTIRSRGSRPMCDRMRGSRSGCVGERPGLPLGLMPKWLSLPVL